MKIALNLPKGVSAKVELPAPADSKGVSIAGKPVDAKRVGTRWHLEKDVSGTVVISVE
jgi:hypothetical protein